MSASKTNNQIKIFYTVPLSMTWGFLIGNLAYQKKYGFRVGACSTPGVELDHIVMSDQLDAKFEVDMARGIDPLKDVVSLWRLFQIMRKYAPSVVVAGTPKGSFLGMLAAFFARIPIRISQRRGLSLETAKGLNRFFLFITEKISNCLATEVWHVSNSLQTKCIQLGIASPKKSKVMLKGTGNGINSNKFSYNQDVILNALNYALQFKIMPTDTIIGYVGRISNEKGIIELCQSFEQIQKRHTDLKLLLVGNFDSLYPLPEKSHLLIKNNPNIIVTGTVSCPEYYIAMMDIFVFPSYREGFPNAPMEAASMGLPIVGTNVTGVVDAVIDGETGKIVPVKDVEKLTEAIVEYIENPSLCIEHGINGSRRVARDFVPENIWRAYNIEIKELLKKKGLVSEDFCNNTGEPVSIDLDKHEQELRQWLAVKRHLLHKEPLDSVCQTFQVDKESMEEHIKNIKEGII